MGLSLFGGWNFVNSVANLNTKTNFFFGRWNFGAQLGDNTTNDQYSPELLGISNVARVGATFIQSFAVFGIVPILLNMLINQFILKNRKWKCCCLGR